jgi:signal transduction histidine kinase
MSASIRKPVNSIVIALASLIAVMWVAVGLSIAASRQMAMDDATNEARNLMIAFREHLSFVMSGIEGEMNVLADRIRKADGEFDLHRWAQESVLLAPGAAEATLIGPHGEILSTTFDADPAGINLSDREHFKVQLDGRVHGLYIGRAVVSHLTGKLFIPVTLRIDSADGRFLGVLSVLVSPEPLTNLHKLIDLGPRGVMTIAGTDNVIGARYSADSLDGTKGVDVSLANAGRPDFPPNGEATRQHAGTTDGVARIYSDGRVGSYPLVVTVGLEIDEELAAWYAERRKIVLLALAATLLLGGLGFYLSREMRIRARREDELATANRALISSMEKVEAASEAKSLFLANMSHELRTPLNAIIGYSEVIRDHTFGAAATARYQEYASHVVNSGGHLLKLITDILDTAKLEAGKMELDEEVFDLREIAAASLTQVRIAAQNKRIELVEGQAARPRTIHGDSRRLRQVLINLLSNAVKFTPEGGTVSLSSSQAANGDLVIVVADTGMACRLKASQ